MIKRFSGICALAVALAVVLAPVAKADGVNTFVWQLPSSPTSSNSNISFDSSGLFFTVSASISENGAAPALGILDFYTSGDGGGFDSPTGDTFLMDAFGLQVFTVPNSMLGVSATNLPTFLLGAFPLMDFAPSGSMGPDNPGNLATLTISNGPGGIDTFRYNVGSSNVPEPSTIGLLAIGFLVFALRFSLKRPVATQIQS